MQSVSLSHQTNHSLIDMVLQATVNLFEATFPSQIRGYYLWGSYATATALPKSDIDLAIVFKLPPDHVQLARAKQVIEACNALSPIELHLFLENETTLLRFGSPFVKRISCPIYGEDIREDMPEMDINLWRHLTIHRLLWFQANVLRAPLAEFTYPFTYPDPEGEYYGYDRSDTLQPQSPTLRQQPVNGTEPLVRTIGLSAAVLVALQKGEVVASKADAASTYCRVIGDSWAPFVEHVFRTCRDDWQYALPATAREKQLLRGICEKALAFENHCLEVCKHFFLRELQTPQNTDIWIDLSQWVDFFNLPGEYLSQGAELGVIESRENGGERSFRIPYPYTLSASLLAGSILYPGTDVSDALTELLHKVEVPLVAIVAQTTLDKIARAGVPHAARA